MKENIIAIRMEYVFDNYWSVAVHRSGITRIYHEITHSTWNRIRNLASIAKSQSGTLSGEHYQYKFY